MVGSPNMPYFKPKMRRIYLIFFIIFTLVGAPVVLRADVRANTRLDSGWRFLQGDATNAEQANFDDSGWPEISIPHNWGWENAQQGEKFYHGPGWYRRELNVGKPAPGKRYFLRFEAASQVADVYVNGKWLGQHRGAFGAFCFEITKALSASGSNMVAVRVNNAKEPDIAPLGGDFSVYGGLYRPVHLIVTSAENFTLTDHGSPGVAWSQTSVSSEQGVLDVTAQISNGTTNKQSLSLVASVYDAAGNCVASKAESIMLAPRDTAPYFLRVTVPQPHLWNGRRDPYLYRAVVELCDIRGIVDAVEQPLGLRYYLIDPDRGFFLNGQPYPVYGVNRHQDMMGKGWAISEADMEQDVSFLKELGATAVRGAHYQNSDYFYSLCDRAGILVWAELPQVNDIHDTPDFENSSRNQLLDLIRQNINHPSIFCWSLFNEIGSGGDDPHRELQDMNNVAHGEDPTRPTIAATCINDLPQMNRITDLLGWNVYPGWYPGWGTKDDYGALLDKLRNASRHGGFCVSEYGAGANPNQHEDNPKAPKVGGPWHPEEWQAEVHEAAWAAIKARPFVWGSFVWCLFDFAVDTRHEGGQPGLNDKGLITRDRLTKKDAFYFYKANWSDEPVLYIASRRFTERTNAVTNVKLYSNAPAAELFVNGVSQGKNNDGTNCVFIWKNVTLKPGENKIAARAIRNGQPLTDNCIWTLK
jgi:beta-galactosidase